VRTRLGKRSRLDAPLARRFAGYLVHGRGGPGIEILPPPGAGRADASTTRRAYGGALVGAGVAGLIAGGALVGVGLARSCSAGAADARCSRRVGPAEIGAAAAGLGTAALAVGVYLWRRGRTEKARPGLTASPFAPLVADAPAVGIGLALEH